MIHILGIECIPEIEGAFCNFLDEIYIPAQLKVSGVKNVIGYQIRKTEEGQFKYLVITHFNTVDSCVNYLNSTEAISMKNMMHQTWGQGSTMLEAEYIPIKTWPGEKGAEDHGVGLSPLVHINWNEPSPEVEEKYNHWYNEIHVPMILRFPKILRVTRYRIGDAAGNYKKSPRYCTFYEFESEKDYLAYENSLSTAEAFEEMRETWKKGGFTIRFRAQYKPMKIF